MTVFSNLIGFSVGEINRIDRWKQYSLKYFRNALTRMTDLMTMPLAYITKIYTVFQNISVVFAMLILGEQLSTRK